MQRGGLISTIHPPDNTLEGAGLPEGPGPLRLVNDAVLGALIAHAAHNGRLPAGTRVGTGSDQQGTGGAIDGGGRGCPCLVELRMIETIRDGAATTPWLRFGNRVHIEMLDDDGGSTFGAIDPGVIPDQEAQP